MSSTASPYGLRPVKMAGGAPYSGATGEYKIASGYDTNIFRGSVVSVVAGGTIELVTTNGDNSTGFPAGTIGVFVGCSFTSPVTGQVVDSPYWPADTVASDAVAYVIDDPNVVFAAQADGSVTQADLGQNTHFAAVQSGSTGNTATGNSTTAVTATTATTSGFAFRIVGFDDRNGSVGDEYTDLLVQFLPDSHSFTNKTGI